MTIEEAQEQILELTEKIKELESDKETLSQNNDAITKECENLRTINQKYYNKLIMQESQKDENQNDPEDVPSCEEFAKTLAI